MPSLGQMAGRGGWGMSALGQMESWGRLGNAIMGSCMKCLLESGQTSSVALSRVDCTTFVASHSS